MQELIIIPKVEQKQENHKNIGTYVFILFLFKYPFLPPARPPVQPLHLKTHISTVLLRWASPHFFKNNA